MSPKSKYEQQMDGSYEDPKQRISILEGDIVFSEENIKTLKEEIEKEENEAERKSLEEMLVATQLEIQRQKAELEKLSK